MHIEYRNGTIGVFTDSNDKGWLSTNRNLNKLQRKQLDEELEITIKKYR